MNDLDFDELDKAIGDADVNTPQVDDSATAPDAAPVAPAQDSAVSDADVPESVAPEETNEAAGAEDLQAANDPLANLAAAAEEVANNPVDTVPDSTEETADAADAEDADDAPSRSQGRFMDMVHHSSDMTVTRPTAVPPSPVQVPPSETPSRTAGEIEPLNEDIAPETSEVAEAPEEPVAEDAPADVAPEEDLAKNLSSIDFSQPEPELTAEGDEPATDEATLDEESNEEAAPESDADVEPAQEDETESLSSPFLADAQVEKRPLGGTPASVDTIESTASDAASPVSSDASAQPQPIYAPDSTIGPLAAPAKKGGGLTLIIIIVALIVVGAGAGLAAWFFILK